jgi:hypothetical protein
MQTLALSFIIFILVVGGIFLGMFLRHALPQTHLSKESQDVVRLGVGLIATIAGLVLGMLIASAKNSFDTKSNQVKQIATDILLLNVILEQYGLDAQPIRQQIQSGIAPFMERIWHDDRQADSAEPFVANGASERVYVEIQKLTPMDNEHRALQARAAQVSVDIAQLRLTLFVEAGNSIPAPFLGVLVFWLVIIFASFSLFSDMNATVFVALCTFAFSASAAIYLILELNDPFRGLMSIPTKSMLGALGALHS